MPGTDLRHCILDKKNKFTHTCGTQLHGRIIKKLINFHFMQSLVKTCLLKSRLVIGWLSTTLTSPVYSNTGHLCWDLQGQSLSCRMTKLVCSDVFFSYPITSTLLHTCTDMKIIKSYYIMFRDLNYWILADALIVGWCWIWYFITKNMFFCTRINHKLLLWWTSCYR